tara:strand:- start:2721 stop:3131 length:411 start_codon:yes stop_codon:yes gene_type:complete
MLNNFSTDLLVITVNGRIMTDWGETATPVTDEPIDPKTALRRGQGGNAVRLDRSNPGRRVNLFFNPGSPDSAFMQGLFNSNANITFSSQQIGTLEAAIGTEGAIVNDASVGRGGTTITDDNYILEFNRWTGAKGGE